MISVFQTFFYTYGKNETGQTLTLKGSELADEAMAVVGSGINDYEAATDRLAPKAALAEGLLLFDQIILPSYTWAGLLNTVGLDFLETLVREQRLRFTNTWASNFGVVFSKKEMTGTLQRFSLINKRTGKAYAEDERVIEALIGTPGLTITQRDRLLALIHDSTTILPADEMGKLAISETNKDLRNGNLRDHIKVTSLTSDKVILGEGRHINRIMNANMNLIAAERLGAKSVRSEGFIADLTRKKFYSALASERRPEDELLKLLEFRGIPDLAPIVENGILPLEEIFKLSQQAPAQRFREWFHKTLDQEQGLNASDVNAIPKKYAELLGAPGFFDRTSVKATQLLFGVLPRPLDFGTSALSLALEGIFKYWKPTFFVEEQLRRSIDHALKTHRRKEKKNFFKTIYRVNGGDPCPCRSGRQFKKCHG